MVIYYHACAIISVLLSSVFLLRWKHGISVHYPIIFLFIPIINLGYLKMATAKDLYEALFANSIGYLDGCFLQLIFFLYILSFCKLRVPKAVPVTLLALGSGVFFFAVNVSDFDLLYKSAELRSIGGVTYLVKEYGPIHTVYYTMIAFYLVANLTVLIYSFTRKNVSRINSIMMLSVYLAVIIAFFVGRKISPALDLLPIAYTFAEVIYLIVMSKINLYDVSGSTITNISEQGSIGFISFDTKRRYLGCTDFAVSCIPELSSLYIDQPLTAEKEVFGKILDCFEKVDAGQESPYFYITQDDISYKVTAGHMVIGNKIRGYQLRTEENTDETRRMEELRRRERQKGQEAQMLRLEKTSAEAANEAKSAFLAQMSHEIRTPINAVLGMNEMILRENKDPEINEYARNIRSAGRTLLSLINSILDFSKIESGKMEILPVRYETAVMINDLVNSISQRAADKGLEFIIEADATLPSMLLGDDVRIRQVISNLLTNAVKYTEKGSVKLVIRWHELDVDGSLLLYVEVSDTGIGIKEEDMKGLFESFRRLDETHNRHIEGTGLGMSIVTALLRMMDSELQVRSVYGVGSVFSFVLRQEIVSAVPMGDFRRAAVEGDDTDTEADTLWAPDAKVLVVDDNDMNLQVAKNLLRIYGITASLAGSGEAALKELSDKQYNIVFLDHMMPKMDGIETLREIRKRNYAEGTPMIALTANAIVGAREKYISEGFDDYLTKPIESRILEKQLRKYLPAGIQQKKPSEPPKSAPAPEENSDVLSYDELIHIRECCPELNAAAGMGWCMDSKEFWYDTLVSFVQSDKSDELCAAFEARDFELYRITVHSIKSTAKSIGADLLSERARRLEFAARDGDLAFIEAEHPSFTEDLRKLNEGIGKLLETAEAK